MMRLTHLSYALNPLRDVTYEWTKQAIFAAEKRTASIQGEQ